MPEQQRRCLACDLPLVRNREESSSNFQKRRYCSRSCAGDVLSSRLTAKRWPPDRLAALARAVEQHGYAHAGRVLGIARTSAELAYKTHVRGPGAPSRQSRRSWDLQEAINDMDGI